MERTPAQLKAIEKLFEDSQDRLVLQASDLSLETIAAMAVSEAIDLAPQFQRRERWSVAKQSALIESFLLNIPVPPVYLAEDDFGRYSVIDGKQRITAIRDFMTDNLTLTGLERFKDLVGMRFRDLPPPLHNALVVRPYVRAVTLLRQSSPEVKYEVFHRLNVGGEPLNAQEIRNVIFRGPFNDLIYQLTEHPFLRRQLKITSERAPAFRKMVDAEFVLRFLALFYRWTDFSGNLRQTLDQFMQQNLDRDLAELEGLAMLFRESIRRCEAFWGTHAFQRFDGNGWRDLALAGLFDAEMIASGTLEEGSAAVLSDRQEAVLRATRELFGDSEFDSSVRVGTNTPSSVRHRITALTDMLARVAEW